MCPQPTVQNLITNPGFDTNMSGWTIEIGDGTVTWSPDDSTGCPFSGSARISSATADVVSRRISQCVRVAPSTSYNFGVRSRGPKSCSVEFYSQANCVSQTNTMDLGELWLNGEWSGDLTFPIQTATDTVSVRVACYHERLADSFLDAVYLTPAPGKY